jgi:hypothetical protein
MTTNGMFGEGKGRKWYIHHAACQLSCQGTVEIKETNQPVAGVSRL